MVDPDKQELNVYTIVWHHKENEKEGILDTNSGKIERDVVKIPGQTIDTIATENKCYIEFDEDENVIAAYRVGPNGEKIPVDAKEIDKYKNNYKKQSELGKTHSVDTKKKDNKDRGIEDK